MFERFTHAARTAVIAAQGEAKREEDGEITTTHLLSALLADPAATATSVLARHGVTAEMIADDIRETRRRAGLSAEDTAALNELGIDVERVVERVEQAHGQYALAGGHPKRRRLFGVLEHRPFTLAAWRVLERSLREAIDLGDRHIGTGHILLALVQQPDPAADLLTARGVDYPAVRRDLSRHEDNGPQGGT